MRPNGDSEYDEALFLQKKGEEYPLLKQAEPPRNEAALFVWGLYFNKLRGSGISMTEIKNYMDLYGVDLVPWQIDLIFIIHNAVEGYFNDKHKKAGNKGKK